MSLEKNVKRQQDALKGIVDKYIAPTMKELDFKKKNRRFTKKKDLYMKELNVYSSRWNTSDEVNFAIELFVYDNVGKEIVASRIKGDDGKEKWYTLISSVEPNVLGEEIKQDILDYAVPFFDKY